MKGRDGFTLLEAVVSLAILSLVGLAALGAVQQDLDVAGRARDALEATALLEDRLEAVRILDEGDLDILPDSVARGMFAAPFERYRWTVDVEPVGDAPGLYDATVEVTGTGAKRSATVRLYRPLIAGGASPGNRTAGGRLSRGRVAP